MKWIWGQLEQFRLTRGEGEPISTVFSLPDISISLDVKTRCAQTHRECCGVRHHSSHLARPRTALLSWQISGQQRKSFPVSNLYWNINFTEVGSESVHCIELGTQVISEHLWKGRRKIEEAIRHYRDGPKQEATGPLARSQAFSGNQKSWRSIWTWRFYLKLQGWGQSGEQSGEKTVPLFIYVQRVMIWCVNWSTCNWVPFSTWRGIWRGGKFTSVWAASEMNQSSAESERSMG